MSTSSSVAVPVLAALAWPGESGEDAPDGGDEQVSVAGSVAGKPDGLHPRPDVEGEHVAGAGNLEQDRGPHLAGERLGDGGDGGDGRLVAGQQQMRRPGGRSPLLTAGGAGVGGVGTDHHDPVAGDGAGRPPGGGTGLAVEHEVDVELAQLRPYGAHGVGADRVLQLRGERTPAPVPVVAAADGGEAAAGQREDHLDPLVEALVGEVGQLLAAEGDPDETRAEPSRPQDLHGEGAIGGNLRRTLRV